MTNKSGLRKEFLAKRKKLDLEYIENQSLRISELFESLYQENPTKSVHIFLPIKRQYEINTWPIIQYLRQLKVVLMISKSDFRDNSLTHYFLEESTRLRENEWGIPEPVDAPQADISQLEMVIIPLVIFDKQGYRIGYGKGFYDKFLSRCPKKLIRIGLSLFQPVSSINTDSHDVKMDFCITPDQIYRF